MDICKELRGVAKVENRETQGYRLILTNRELLEANGIIEVESFDENQIIAASKLGPLLIKGERLHIIQLNLEEGKLVIDGEVGSIQYIENKKLKMKQKGKGIIERLFK